MKEKSQAEEKWDVVRVDEDKIEGMWGRKQTEKETGGRKRNKGERKRVRRETPPEPQQVVYMVVRL